MKSCNKCLTVETADTITFDGAGVCSVCRQVEHKLTQVDWEARYVDLQRLLLETRACKAQYDCIVPFSGGKDSTFQLWYVVRVLGLRPLVVRYNHWGYRPLVEKNNVRTFKTLGVEVLDWRPNWGLVTATMVESLERKGDSCWHCHTGVYSFPMHMAVKFEVPLVMWGESLKEYQSWLDPTAKEEVDEVRFNRAMNLGMTAEDMRLFLEGNPAVDRRDLEWFLYPSKKSLESIRSVCLGDYIKWDTKKQVKTIKRELGWEGQDVEGIPPEYDYEKIECQFQGVRDYIKFLKRGFGRTNHLANIDIRHGRMTRETGERLQAEYDGKEPASLSWFLEVTGLTRSEFHSIVARHVVDPWEMPSGLPVGQPLKDMKEWA